MLRSLNSGVSGLRNQQVRLDVIGNNIANVNTVGYKSHRVNFQEQFSQTLRGGSAPSGSLGGTNPTQVGLGVTVGSIDLVQSQGSLNPTGKNTDLAISGEGFFIISDGKQQVYTRDGAFDFDRSGNLVKISNGFRVMGWNAEMDPDGTTTVNSSRGVENLVVPAGTTLPPQATGNITIGSNLEAMMPVAPAAGSSAMSSVSMYDSQGNIHKGSIKFTKIAANTWNTSFVPDVDSEAFFSMAAPGWIPAVPADNTTTPPTPRKPPELPIGSVSFNDRGILSGYGLYGGAPLASPADEVPPTFNLVPQAGAVKTLTISLKMGSKGKSDGVTQFNDPKSDPSQDYYNTTVVMTDQDGYSSGALSGVSIGSDGKMMGLFTNGRSRILGQVAMATFTNPVGLAVNGDNIFAGTPNSGEAQIGIAGSGSRGLIAPGSLENSNVDLASSFADLIVAQRGLQSNSKIITTSDEVLQELMSLKR